MREAGGEGRVGVGSTASSWDYKSGELAATWVTVPGHSTCQPRASLGCTLPCGTPAPAGLSRSQRMNAPGAWLLCLLLLGLAHQHSTELRTPDINPAWYTGRGIRPVGRFGRRRAALGDGPKPGLQRPPACFPLAGGAEPSQGG
ncbi:prolactin-releasing peptide isoform X1 [Tursiops truncatus]|uniref:prolactin-releasing peptide isoform X1 n=1 Tax=Tursiops truncatus TaxID=9739 RepID=UPI003CCF2497